MEKQKRLNALVKAGVLCSLLCVMALVVVPIGPVPFSLSILAVTLTGALLPPAWALGSVAAYLLLGLCGLPVFAGFSAGAAVLFGPTGGYLFGYLLLVLGTSLACQAKWRLPLCFFCALLGLLGCYTLGTLWFLFVTQMGVLEALWICVIPFILPDLGKIALALLVAKAVQKRLHHQRVGE